MDSDRIKPCDQLLQGGISEVKSRCMAVLTTREASFFVPAAKEYRSELAEQLNMLELTVRSPVRSGKRR